MYLWCCYGVARCLLGVALVLLGVAMVFLGVYDGVGLVVAMVLLGGYGDARFCCGFARCC